MKPEELMMSKGITQEELVAHWDAYEYLSERGSDVKVKQIPRETKEKIASFYKVIRANGYLPGKPNAGNMRWGKVTDYYYCWMMSLRNMPHRPEFENVTIEEVREMFKKGPGGRGNMQEIKTIRRFNRENSRPDPSPRGIETDSK